MGQLGGRKTSAFEFVTSVELDEIEDGTIEGQVVYDEEGVEGAAGPIPARIRVMTRRGGKPKDLTKPIAWRCGMT